MDEKFLLQHVDNLKKQKNRTEQQELLILLASKTEKDKITERKITVILKAEKAKIDVAKKQLAVQKLLKSEEEKKRKEKTKSLIKLGMLVESLGISLDKMSSLQIRDILVEATSILESQKKQVQTKPIPKSAPIFPQTSTPKQRYTITSESLTLDQIEAASKKVEQLEPVDLKENLILIDGYVFEETSGLSYRKPLNPRQVFILRRVGKITI